MLHFPLSHALFIKHPHMGPQRLVVPVFSRLWTHQSHPPCRMSSYKTPFARYIYIYTGWWFQRFFIFHNIWDNPSHWLIFFRGRGVETTNQIQPVYIYISSSNLPLPTADPHKTVGDPDFYPNLTRDSICFPYIGVPMRPICPRRFSEKDISKNNNE